MQLLRFLILAGASLKVNMIFEKNAARSRISSGARMIHSLEIQISGSITP